MKKAQDLETCDSSMYSPLSEPVIQASDSQFDQWLAIDLGAEVCCSAAPKDNDQVVIIPMSSGSRVCPAYIAFTHCGRLIGEAAKNDCFANAETTLTNIKRLCGRSYNDPIISQDLALLPKVVCDDNDRLELVFNVNAEETCNCYPELLLSMLLDGIKQRAESFLNNRRLVAVITVSPSMSTAQRAAILDAACVANLPVNRLLSDPLAAASAFRHHELDGLLKQRTDFMLVVVDVGACTSDASVVRLHASDNKLRLGAVSLLSTVGSATLGGIDFDRQLCEVLLQQLRRADRAEVRNDKAAMRRLMATSEQLKRTLSACSKANVELVGLHDNINLFAVIKREQFEEACEQLFEEVAGFVRTALAEAGLQSDDIDEVLLLGGGQRIPRLRQKIRTIFNFREMYSSLSAEEALACGCAVAAKLELSDLVSCTYGVRQPSGLLLPLIRRREPLPARVTKNFMTMEENQSAMTIEIYEGERPFAHQNQLACRITTKGFPNGAKGSRGTQLILTVDLNGVLSVMSSALDDKSQASFSGYQGLMAGIKSNIFLSRRITKEDVRKMTFQAEHIKMDDELHRMRLAAREELVALANQLAQQMKNPETIEFYAVEELVMMDTTCQNALDWLCNNPTANLDEIDKQMASLRNICEPLLNA